MSVSHPIFPTQGERKKTAPDPVREVMSRHVHVATNASVNWSWYNQKQGLVQWTFRNLDSKPHSLVLLRNSYYFGGAFWPVYYANSNGRGASASNPSDNFGTNFLDGTGPIPELVDNGVASNNPPLALIRFGGSSTAEVSNANSQAIFVFTLASGTSWSMLEGGFSSNMTPSGISLYEVTAAISGLFCIGYDQSRVTDWDNQTGTTLKGYSPNPDTFNTWMLDAESDAPFDKLPYVDSYAIGKCP